MLAITNVMGSQATRDADGVLYTRAGLEIGVAATKTFVSQVAAMYLIALQPGRAARRRWTAPSSSAPIAELKHLPHRSASCSSRDAPIEAIAAEVHDEPTSSSTSAGTSGCRSRSRAR